MALQRLQRRAGCAFSVFSWNARKDRDRDHDSVRVRACALEAFEQLKASLAVMSDTALVFGDETLIIVRRARHRLWFSHGVVLLVYGQGALPQSLLIEH
jgi:hypothetical protein